MFTKVYRGMKCRRMGDSGLWVSEIGLGMWKWGDPSYDKSRVGDHEGFKILDRALELGAIDDATLLCNLRCVGYSSRCSLLDYLFNYLLNGSLSDLFLAALGALIFGTTLIF